MTYGKPGENFGLEESRTGEAKRARAKPKPPKRQRPEPMPGLAKQQGFTPEAGATVVALISAGHSLEAASAGVERHRTTVWRWFKHGLADLDAGIGSELAKFARNYQLAEGQALAQMEGYLVEQARQDWRANVRYLASKRPEVWSSKATTPLILRIIDRILDHVRERATPEEYERFVDLLSEPIEVEEVEL
jgi:hypothetical protein